MLTTNQLTPEQVGQLVDSITDPMCALFALRDAKQRFTPEQQQRLVDTVTKSNYAASIALSDVSWLTEAQKGQLRVVA